MSYSIQAFNCDNSLMPANNPIVDTVSDFESAKKLAIKRAAETITVDGHSMIYNNKLKNVRGAVDGLVIIFNKSLSNGIPTVSLFLKENM